MEQKKISNRDLLLPYGLPYFVYVGIASLGRDRIPDELRYILKIIIVPLLLYWAWKWYVPVTGPKRKSGSVIYGVIFGILGFFAWCLCLAPFIGTSGEPWSFSGFILRLVAASLVVPVFEEIFIRGYFFRAAYQWGVNQRDKNISHPIAKTLDEDHIGDVPAGVWNLAAVGISTLAFTIGHTAQEWPAAIVYSLIMSYVLIQRKDLLSCIVAHGVTNFILSLYVYFSGNWGFW